MSGWLQHIPAGYAYVLGAAVVVSLWAAARLGLERHARGRAVLSGLHAAEGGFLALLLAVMILLSFLQILLRNLANTGFVWVDPLLRHVLLWVGFLGALLAARLGRHINIDALSRFLPPRGLRAARTLTNLLAATVCLLLSNAGMGLVRQEAEFGRPGFLGVPLWIVQLVIPYAMLAMSSRFLGHALGTLLGRELAGTVVVTEVRT